MVKEEVLFISEHRSPVDASSPEADKAKEVIALLSGFDYKSAYDILQYAEAMIKINAKIP